MSDDYTSSSEGALIVGAIVIPREEVSFRTSRSSGPGGQNVNKVETKVTLLFDLAGSAALTRGQKERVAAKLGGRINRDGVLRVSSQRHRTQKGNRAAVEQRFVELLTGALARPKRRRPTKVPRAAHERRLEEKRRRSQRKRDRRSPSGRSD